MALFSFSRLGFEKLKVIENENGHISLNLTQIKKNKDTLFSPTFKVEGNKVVLFFHFELK